MVLVYNGTDTTVSLNSCTITYNHADYDASGGEHGGGIYLDAGTLTVQNTIIAENIRRWFIFYDR